MFLRYRLKDLVEQMAKDFDWAAHSNVFEEVLTDYVAILNYAAEIFLLPDLDLKTDLETARAIEAFIKGDETRDELKNRLKEILENYKKKTR